MIIGHQKEIEHLKKIINEYERGAFMLLGPEAVGKFHTIKTLLKDLREENEVIILDSEDKIIKLSTAHLIQNLLSYSTKNRRFIVLNDAHKLNKEAQNALLKIVEEIKTNALLFFVTHRPFKIYPTIRSRMQKISFRLVPKEEIYNYLKSQNVKEETINLLLEFFPGQIGKIIDCLKNKEKFNLISKVYFGKNIFEKLLLVEKIEENVDLEEFLKYLILFERSKLLKGDKNAINRIKFLEGVYLDSDYFLNKGLQISNLIMNFYG